MVFTEAQRVAAKVADAIRRHEPETSHREAYCSCGFPIGEWGREWPDHLGAVAARALGLPGATR